MQWTGLLRPYTYNAWIAIAITIVVVALILGICLKFSNPDKKTDWTLHFLDALHPMCGRNMMLPGLGAAHLGKG